MKPRSMQPHVLAAGLLASVTAFASPHGTSTVCSGGADEILCSGFDGSGSTIGPDIVYGNLTDFLTAIAPGYYQNDFHDANGADGPLYYSDPVSGIAYTVDSRSPIGLWNWNGVVSTNNSGDQIVVTFTGTPVTAIGGNFWTADSKANPNPGFVAVITLSDGTMATLTSTGSDDFRGFTATQPIASISIDAPAAPGQGDNIWAAMDNLIVGSSIPDVVCGNLNGFLTATAPGYYQNDFHDANGPSGPLQYSDPISGIAYTVDASSPAGLWSWNGVVSTNSSGDQIVVTFTGTPVTAIGGNFWTLDSNGLTYPGFETVITLSDGTTATLTSNGPDDFRGFTTPQPIASITIDAPAAPGQGDNVWAAMDNFIVGSVNN